MPPRKPTAEAVHVAPSAPPMQVAPEPKPVPAKECCATCHGSINRAGMLQCHGNPPSAIYRNVIMGVGPTGDALWPTVKPDDWCLKWTPKPDAK